jgi:hypothetical protein
MLDMNADNEPVVDKDKSTILPEATSVPIPTRKGRGLLGWMPAVQAGAFLSGSRQDKEPDPSHLALANQAREVVGQRAAGIDQSNAFFELPSELVTHLKALEANPKSANIRAERGEPRLIDLTKICAAQPVIYTEDAVRRVKGIQSDDLVAIAQMTVPIPVPRRMPIAFDPTRQVWIISSANPNLRVAGNFSAEIENKRAFGFLIELATSYMQVAGLAGRYFLRDGYHRAYGLLASGITVVPGFVQEFQTFEEVGMPVGLLPQNAYLGEQPARLTDYLDEAVSTEVDVPVTQKTIVIQALEVPTLS